MQCLIGKINIGSNIWTFCPFLYILTPVPYGTNPFKEGGVYITNEESSQIISFIHNHTLYG